MPDDILLNKGQIIRRCLARVREEYGDNPANLANPTKQDSIVINIQRACEAAIDLAMHFVALQSLGIPQTSRDAFTLLETAGILSAGTSKQMRAMVGFRNIAIHNYQDLAIEVLQAIIQHHLPDFDRFLEECSNKR
ncbi:MAG TPA: DUF86 domain-containing protein [Terriglobia bacterium]|nr:DUF86 domain-containing protein [Terriglobia bacterium]